MKREELKKRASLVDERAKNLFKRYPLVVGVVVGFALGKLL
jgi:hypothetical protein